MFSWRLFEWAESKEWTLWTNCRYKPPPKSHHQWGTRSNCMQSGCNGWDLRSWSSHNLSWVFFIQGQVTRPCTAILLASFNTKNLVSKFRKLTTICFNTDVKGKGFNTTGGLQLFYIRPWLRMHSKLIPSNDHIGHTSSRPCPVCTDTRIAPAGPNNAYSSRLLLESSVGGGAGDKRSPLETTSSHGRSANRSFISL
jgi:hypothetical protein